MPKLIMPGSDDARLTFIKKAVETAEKDAAAGNPFLSAETIAATKEFIPPYEEKSMALSQKLSARSKEVREWNEALENLKTGMRDMWEVVKRRVARSDEPAEVLTYYQLPLSGIIPNPNTREEWLTLAAKMIDGDAKAVTAGYPAMLNPAADELQTVLDKAGQELGDVAGVDREYDAAQEALAELRPGADEIINEILAELRFNLRKKDAASQRRIMRTYGATYKYLKGEPLEEDEIPAEEVVEI